MEDGISRGSATTGEALAQLLKAADAVVGRANPLASVINGKVTHYRIDKALMDDLRAAVKAAKAARP